MHGRTQGIRSRPGRCSLLAALAFAAATPLIAGDTMVQAISDNSFLVEEAYNQEKNVVQHISVFTHDLRGSHWTATFTQEWPAGNEKHQLSYTLPVARGEGRQFGAVLINYRYQLIGDGDATTAVAPRVSFFFPSGTDSNGLQLEIPLSHIISDRLASHSDAGVTFLRNRGAVDVNFAQSFVFALSTRAQVVLESVWNRTDKVDGFLVCPGVRWAYNKPGGLQIVPGIGIPIGIGPSAGERSILLYLSFEHPFR